MSRRKAGLTRREFLAVMGTASAAATLSGCRRLGSRRGDADLVLLGGKIITVDADDTIAEAVAVKDGQIAGVGTTDEITDYVGENTNVIQLNGKTVTPGLVDSHIHVLYFGKQAWEGFTEIRPPTVSSKEGLLEAVAARAALEPEGAWISGNQGFLLPLSDAPSRWELDEVAPNHPVYLKHMSGQYGVVNSLALEMAGVDTSTPNPAGGVIVKDPTTGELTGMLNHYSAQNLVGRFAPGWGERSDEELYEDLLRGQDLCLAAGYTSGQDVIVGSARDVDAYRRVAEAGDLKMRMYLLRYVSSAQAALEAIESTEAFEMDMLTFGGWKMAIDGGLAAGTSLMYDRSMAMSNRSYPYYDQEIANRMVSRFHREGYQVSFHCSGDEAVDMAINAIEAALEERPDPDHRHKIEHALFPTQEALERIRDLGIIVSTQPQWITILADAYRGVSNEATMERFMPLRTMLDMGISLAFGCDVPATPILEPNWAFAGATTRTTFNGNTYNPEEIISIQEALRIHTMGSAYASFEEDVKGSIEEGKVADMVVWSRDLYALESTDDLRDLEAETTIVGGEIV